LKQFWIYYIDLAQREGFDVVETIGFRGHGDRPFWSVFSTGDTPGYRYGENAWTPIRAALNGDGSTFTVNVAPAEGHYEGMSTERAVELRLPGSWPPSSVNVNGESLTYSKKGDTWLALSRRYVDDGDHDAPLPRCRCGESHDPNQPGDGRNRAPLDSFAGKMTRFRETCDILNGAWPVAWSPDRLIDAMQEEIASAIIRRRHSRKSSPS
jgi:Domain of unknown function (DUF5110)